LQATDVATDEDALKIIAQLLPKYVKNFEGPKAADGSPVTIEEVCEKVYFITIVKALADKLVNSARPPSKPSAPSVS
jgi:hypothetical protein